MSPGPLSAWLPLAVALSLGGPGLARARAADSLREYYCFQYSRISDQKEALATPDALRAYAADPKLLTDGVCLQTVTCAPLNDKAKKEFYEAFAKSAPGQREKATSFEQIPEKERNKLFKTDYEAMSRRRHETHAATPTSRPSPQPRGYIADWSASSVGCLPKRLADNSLVCPSPTDCKNDRHIRLQSTDQVPDNVTPPPEGTLVPLGNKKSVGGAH
jgi:hypothetical protein